MKRISLLIPALFLLGGTAGAQTLKIHSGQVTVAVPASQAGTMNYGAGGATLSVMGRTYDTSEIDSITVDRTPVENGTVCVRYDGSKAHVTVAGDIAQHLSVTARAADVSVIAGDGLQTEAVYRLSGASTDGSFFMDGEFKATVELDGLDLTNSRGAAIDIANGKRINVILKDGTTTTLADGAGGTQKACLFVNGHAEFSGTGTLLLTGNARHAYASDEYTLLKPGFGTLRVLKAANDGLHVDQYFKMQGGTVEIGNTKGDCVDVSITKDQLDEFNGQAFIEGGTLTMNVAAEDIKGLKTENLLTISGGNVRATVSGNGSKGISAGTDLLIEQNTATPTRIEMTVTGTTYMPGDALLESKCRGIKVKGNFTFDGGDIRISATGAKSKAISVDGRYTYRKGTLNCPVDAAL